MTRRDRPRYLDGIDDYNPPTDEELAREAERRAELDALDAFCASRWNTCPVCHGHRYTRVQRGYDYNLGMTTTSRTECANCNGRGHVVKPEYLCPLCGDIFGTPQEHAHGACNACYVLEVAGDAANDWE